MIEEGTSRQKLKRGFILPEIFLNPEILARLFNLIYYLNLTPTLTLNILA